MTLIKWQKLFYHRKKKHGEEMPENDYEHKRKEAIKEAKEARNEAEARIDNMIAQINGCGDRWFLRPEKTLDECKEVNGGSDAH